ncbi:DUF6774 domain-containing protein [Lachnospiraceae bacterium LCP25S3_G4]
MNPCERAAFITAIACKIFESTSPENAAIIAAELTQLGDTLSTMVINYEVCSSK